MPGLPVVACVGDIINAFQGSADAMRRMQTHNAVQKPPETKMLENELQLSLEKGRDELARYKEMFAAECGYNVPPKEPFFTQFVQLNEIKSRIEAMRILLDTLLTHEVSLPDPRTTQDDAITLRSTAIQTIKELHRHMLTGMGPQHIPSFAPSSYPPSSYVQTSSSMPDQHQAPPPFKPYSPPRQDMPLFRSQQLAQIQPSPSPARSDEAASGHTASSPPIPHDSQFGSQSPRESNDFSWAMNPWRQDNTRSLAQAIPISQGSRARATPWVDEDAPSKLTDQLQETSLSRAPRLDVDRTLPVEPLNTLASRPPPTSNRHRDSVTTLRTNSSGTSNEIVPIQSESRRLSGIFSRRDSSRRNSDFRQNTIEHVVGEVRSIASAGNDWHGFCRGTFDISENPLKGLEVVQRPWQYHTTKLYLQCKRCAFPGHHCGKKAKPKVPDSRIMVSAKGIRYRWMFLAKSHVKSTESKGGLIDVQEQTARSAYRCNFCYLEGILPHKLGGVETLMNHIWQHHRRNVMSDHVLRRTGCIIGRVAEVSEQFDINIPEYEYPDEHDSDMTRRPGDVLIASSVGLAAAGLGITGGNKESDHMPGVRVGITELSELPEMGRRGSPSELA